MVQRRLLPCGSFCCTAHLDVRGSSYNPGLYWSQCTLFDFKPHLTGAFGHFGIFLVAVTKEQLKAWMGKMQKKAVAISLPKGVVEVTHDLQVRAGG